MGNIEKKENNGDNLVTVVRNFNVFEQSNWDFLGNFEILTQQKKNNTRCVVDLTSAFDIETSTLPYNRLDDGTFVLQDEYLDNTLVPYYNSPLAIMYSWQWAFKNGNNELCVTGRTWDEFLNFCEYLRRQLNLCRNVNLVVYVHNLAYEFQFIQSFFEWNKVFAKSERKVIQALSNEGFEFRCSYFLSNMNLKKFCENSDGVVHGKLVGDLDYNVFRTPSTPLKPREHLYRINDVLGLVESIDYRLQEDTLLTIPLTSTGYVRRKVRNVCNQTPGYHEKIIKAFPKVEVYEILGEAFRGGDTHANRIYSGRNLSNVYSFDLKSSYPAWMIYENYPKGPAIEMTVDSVFDFESILDNYLSVFQIEIFDLELKENIAMPYIDIAHCRERSELEEDNGRVISAAYVLYTCTNLDWEIICNQYDFKDVYVRKLYAWESAPLPLPIQETLMQYFKLKTELDGIPEMKYEYLKSKNELNSIFGMMVTRLNSDDILYNDLNWTRVNKEIKGVISKAKNNPNTFLLYQWGVFITAWARYHLHEVLDKLGMDAVYVDTDSIKFMNKNHMELFEAVNQERLNRIDTYDVKPYAFTKEGERMVLGMWEYEGMYPEFKTLGAKKYVMTNLKRKSNKDPKYTITVSGMNKELGSKKIKSLDDFSIGHVFEDIGRKVSFYNDLSPRYVNIKGERILATPNVGLVDTTYTLGVSKTYFELIEKNLK